MNFNDEQKPGAGESGKPQLVETPKNSTAKRTVEAGDIAEPVRDMIAGEFRRVKSSRRLSKKYRDLSRPVIQDVCILRTGKLAAQALETAQAALAAVEAISRKQPQSERLFVMPRRQTA